MKRVLMLPILIGVLFLWSCKSNAQEEHNEKENTHKESKGHDKDGEGHGKESKGHDKDGKNHVKEGKGEHSNKERGEHARDKGEDGEGEEDGTQFTKTQTYDVTKHGVRLILKYNSLTNVFEGTMKNTTSKTIERARVEVHLSNGIELGPTKPMTLASKTKIPVILKATEKFFKTWSTHAEVGNNEHGANSERGEGHGEGEKGEHGNERKGEHN